MEILILILLSVIIWTIWVSASLISTQTENGKLKRRADDSDERLYDLEFTIRELQKAEKAQELKEKSRPELSSLAKTATVIRQAHANVSTPVPMHEEYEAKTQANIAEIEEGEKHNPEKVATLSPSQKPSALGSSDCFAGARHNRPAEMAKKVAEQFATLDSYADFVADTIPVSKNPSETPRETIHPVPINAEHGTAKSTNDAEMAREKVATSETLKTAAEQFKDIDSYADVAWDASNDSKESPKKQSDSLSETYKDKYQGFKTTVQRSKITWVENGLAIAKNWLFTGNIPVKIGMLVLFSAVIAFLRYAANQGWFTLPMEYRLVGVAAASFSALAFAWTKRETKRSFSLSVQGGSIGILLLVIFSAVKMYHFIPMSVGFGLSISMVLLATILALAQDSKTLMIMAVLAGFLAPIWLSGAHGSHVVLFTYYAILNLGIFVVVWYKPWRELILLGFVFTYAIGSLWGGLRYTEANFASTEPFVLLFFVLYLLIPLRFAMRASQGDERYLNKINASLLFGTPLVTFGLQIGMLHNQTTLLALSSVFLGIVYGGLALLLRGRDSAFVVLRQAYTGMSVGFLTLAVPIGFSAKVTSAIFALEGVGTVWFGARERRTLTWLSGIILQVASAVSFAIAFSVIPSDAPFLLNAWSISALLITLAAGGCLWSSYHFSKKGLTEATSSLNGWLTEDKLYLACKCFFLWAMTWWLGLGNVEIGRTSHIVPDYLLWLSVSAGILIAVFSYFRESIVARTQALLMLSGGIFAFITVIDTVVGRLSANVFVLTTWDFTVWSAYALIGWGVWRSLRKTDGGLIDASLVTWWLALGTIVSVAIYQVLPHDLSNSGTYWWAMSAVWLLLATLIIWREGLNAITQRPTNSWLSVLSVLIISVISVMLIKVATLSGGENTFWLPLLNSVDSLALVMAGLVALLLSRRNKGVDSSGMTLILLAFVSTVTLRMMHHWGGFSVWNDAPATWHHTFANWGDAWLLLTFGFWLPLFVGAHFAKKKVATVWKGALNAFMLSVITMLSAVWVAMLFLVGDFVPWIPVFNPLSLLQWGILGTVWFGWSTHREQLGVSQNKKGVNILGITLISLAIVVTETLRMMHHWGGYSIWNNTPATWNDGWRLLTFGFWLVLFVGAHIATKKVATVWKGILEAFMLSAIAVLSVFWVSALFLAGDFSPWLPVLNPLSLLQWGILGTVWFGWGEYGERLSLPRRDLVMPVLGLALISVITLRLVHYSAQIEWDTSMFSVPMTQMALTIVWSILGVVAWIVGSHRESRPVWTLGAVLMIAVLLKLIVIDGWNLDDMFGILSFCAYGLLCVIVGYFAPVPPSRNKKEEGKEDSRF